MPTANASQVIDGDHRSAIPSNASTEYRPKPINARPIATLAYSSGTSTPLFGGEQSVLPVHRDHRDDHDGNHERRTDRAEEAERDEELRS